MSLKEKPQILGRRRRFLWVAGAFLVLIFTVAYFFYGLQPSLKTSGAVPFKIVKGESFRSIGAQLSQKELVKSIFVFKLYSMAAGKVQKFQPGTYTLTSNMSVPEIVRIITTPGSNEIVVTIPEGLTIKDVDLLLSKAGVTGDGEFTRLRVNGLHEKYQFLRGVGSLEGFIFPDTYRFEVGASVEDIAGTFLDNFEVKAWPLLQGRRGWYDDLILASYLEREVPDFNDRTVVAGILLKRLKSGMPLQVDATLSYAKCNGLLLGCAGIKVMRDDLVLASPYNTYQRLGWTPMPIANPGQAAIKAAINPKKSPYFYYLSARKTGSTVFSRTLDEHNENRARYL